jgi:hypothetical protein
MTADLRAARVSTQVRRDPTQSITWLRYVWIAAAVGLGMAAVWFGVIIVLYAPVACESNCGSAWPWGSGFTFAGAIIVVAAMRDAVRTFRWRRRAARGASRDRLAAG